MVMKLDASNDKLGLLDSFYARAYHVIRRYLEQMYDRWVRNAVKLQAPKEIEDILPPGVEGKVLKWILKWVIALGSIPIVALFVPVPMIDGSPSLDTTTWIGGLAFIGGLGIAMITVAPWLSEVLSECIIVIIANGIEHGLVKVNDDFKQENETNLEAVRRLAAADKSSRHQLAVDFANSGTLIIFLCVLATVVGILVPIWWRFGILACLTIVMLTTLYSLKQATILTVWVPRMFSTYRVFAAKHTNLESNCPFCRKKAEFNQKDSFSNAQINIRTNNDSATPG